MRVPVSWLQELAAVDARPEEIAERLARSGTSVEGIDRPAADVSGVVVGAVVEVADVPESDKLVVAQVDAGDAGRYSVVAGARNFRAGDKVPLARPGARVTTLPEPVGTRTMLRRYESQGMLCSALELGIGEDHSGILILGPDAPLGADVAGLLGLGDAVLELEITPNRPDLMSILGVAREVAVLFDAPLQPPDIDVTEEGPEAGSLTRVEISDPQGCPRYLARVIEDVAFDTSPAWVQARLAACGVRPLGNLVDATNYVLELTGQPLHAFDMDRLSEERIVVRRAREGERLVTLDDVERKVDADDLVIADARDAQALAGIMGGAASEVGPSTRRVLLESAYFNPRRVYRTARRHDIRTGASQRFEKGANPAMVPAAAALCAELMRRWAGGRVARGAVDVGVGPEPPRITLRRARTNAVLGTDVPPQTADRFLTGLGCEVHREDDTAVVTAPPWRPDLEREIDLIEEIARLYGYDHVPMRVPTGQRGFLTKAQLLRRRVRDVLIGGGLSEATLYSFVSERELELTGLEGPVLEITNPLSSEQRHLRPSLIPNLLRAASTNTARGTPDVRLFEVGGVFTGWEPSQPLPTEREALAAVLTGKADGERWYASPRPVDAFDAKGMVELVLTELGVSEWTLGSAPGMPWHPGRAATVVVAGEAVGVFGEARPSVARAYDLEGGVALLELQLEPLLEAAPSTRTVHDLPRLPPVYRDVALAMDESVPAGEVETVIREAGGPHLESVVLVDVYRGEQLGAGRKSLMFRLVFRAPDRTLTAEEVDGARERLVAAVRERYGAQQR